MQVNKQQMSLLAENTTTLTSNRISTVDKKLLDGRCYSVFISSFTHILRFVVTSNSIDVKATPTAHSINHHVRAGNQLSAILSTKYQSNHVTHIKYRWNYLDLLPSSSFKLMTSVGCWHESFLSIDPCPLPVLTSNGSMQPCQSEMSSDHLSASRSSSTIPNISNFASRWIPIRQTSPKL